MSLPYLTRFCERCQTVRRFSQVGQAARGRFVDNSGHEAPARRPRDDERRLIGISRGQIISGVQLLEQQAAAPRAASSSRVDVLTRREDDDHE